MVVATTEFEALARRSAEQNGLAEPRIVAVPHPIGGVAAETLERRADAALEDIVARLLGH